MIVFKNRKIPTASHGTIVAHPPSLFSHVHEFFGLHGTSEIIGGRGPREITVDIWLSDRKWTGQQPTQLFKELDRLDLQVGKNGTINEQVSGGNGLTRKFKYCTFLGFTPRAVGAQEGPSPLRDEAGLLHTYSNFNSSGGAWFIRGTLRWRQVSI